MDVNFFLFSIVWIIICFIIFYLIFKKRKKIRYIQESVKQEVWEHYYKKCAVCDENRLSDISWHHRYRFSKGGDNSVENIVPLCSYHHNLITRYPKK